MQMEYDIFERPSLGAPIWRASVSRLHRVPAKLEELAVETGNECFAVHTLTKEIVARTNIQEATTPRPTRLVLQIAYRRKIAVERAELLRAHGCEVVSVIGNEAAKLVLTMPQPWDLFIVDGSAEQDGEEEIVGWMKARFPDVPIVALNG